jgi:hypothetical protein
MSIPVPVKNFTWYLVLIGIQRQHLNHVTEVASQVSSVEGFESIVVMSA